MLIRLVALTLIAATCCGLWMPAALAAGGEGSGCASDEDCTGACNTCPGKAGAVAGLAEFASATWYVAGLTEDNAVAVRDALYELDGIAAGLADPATGAVWAAYDEEMLEADGISALLTGHGLELEYEPLLGEPFAPLAEEAERGVVYVLGLGDAANSAGLSETVLQLDGIIACRAEPAFNMFIVDYLPELLPLEAVVDAARELDLPAALPGEVLQAVR